MVTIADQRAPYGPNTAAMDRFLERFEQLSTQELRGTLERWRAVVGRGSWFQAEDAVSAAIAATNRYVARDRMQGRLYDIFRTARWFHAEVPGTAVPGNEATAQYVASSALLALMVRERLHAHEFDVLYAPFASAIPADGVRLDAGAGEQPRLGGPGAA